MVSIQVLRARTAVQLTCAIKTIHCASLRIVNVQNHNEHN